MTAIAASPFPTTLQRDTLRARDGSVARGREHSAAGTITDIFIGGCNDPRTRLVADYARAHASAHPERDTAYFRQSQGRALKSYLRELPDHARINIVAHSWGVPTACRALSRVRRRVELLIGVDPVNRNPLGLLPEPAALPGLRRLVHVEATGLARHWDDGNGIASIGRFWCGDRPAAFRADGLERIDAPYPHSFFAALFEHRPAGAPSAADILRSA